VVQEKVQFPLEANGWHGLVPTVDVVMNLQDKMNELKKEVSAHQHLKNRRRDTVMTRRTVVKGVGQGLWDLSVLLGRIRVGSLTMTGLIILVLVLAVHGGAAKKEWGILILWPRKGPLSVFLWA